MLKRLWLILGPVFCALLMVAALLFFYPINHKHNYTEEKKAAVSLNAEGFKSRTKKQEALSDPQFAKMIREAEKYLIHSIALFLISAPVSGCVLMWCIQQFWLKNMTAITDPTF